MSDGQQRSRKRKASPTVEVGTRGKYVDDDGNPLEPAQADVHQTDSEEDDEDVPELVSQDDDSSLGNPQEPEQADVHQTDSDEYEDDEDVPELVPQDDESSSARDLPKPRSGVRLVYYEPCFDLSNAYRSGTADSSPDSSATTSTTSNSYSLSDGSYRQSSTDAVCESCPKVGSCCGATRPKAPLPDHYQAILTNFMKPTPLASSRNKYSGSLETLLPLRYIPVPASQPKHTPTPRPAELGPSLGATGVLREPSPDQASISPTDMPDIGSSPSESSLAGDSMDLEVAALTDKKQLFVKKYAEGDLHRQAREQMFHSMNYRSPAKIDTPSPDRPTYQPIRVTPSDSPIAAVGVVPNPDVVRPTPIQATQRQGASGSYEETLVADLRKAALAEKSVSPSKVLSLWQNIQPGNIPEENYPQATPVVERMTVDDVQSAGTPCPSPSRPVGPSLSPRRPALPTTRRKRPSSATCTERYEEISDKGPEDENDVIDPKRARPGDSDRL